MNDEDQINWVELTLELPDDIAARMEKAARDAGMSLQCYCIRLLLRDFVKRASVEEKERLQQRLPAIFRRNGCDRSEL